MTDPARSPTHIVSTDDQQYPWVEYALGFDLQPPRRLRRLRMLILALVIAFLILAALIAPVYASPDRWSPGDSQLQIVPGGNCAAEVLIWNHDHDSERSIEGDLTLGGLTVRMKFDLNVAVAGGDRYTAYPPDGFIAVPEWIELMEEYEGSILICAKEGVGA